MSRTKKKYTYKNCKGAVAQRKAKNAKVNKWLAGILLYLIMWAGGLGLANEFPTEYAIAEVNTSSLTPRKPLTAPLTMYNAGDPSQTDGSPCISASGDNICTLIAQGTNVCAANFLPLGTEIEIEGLGKCLVLDRMARRFSDRIDWARPADEHAQAVKWGIKTVSYKIIK